jgi:uncharacterized membrane protein
MTEEIKKETAETTKSASTNTLVKCELVDPKIIAAYARSLPGSPERILKMTENQIRHRQWVEKVEIVSKYLRPLLGLLFAMVITLFCFIAGTVSVFLDQGIAATVFFGFTLLGIISRFIYGTGNK